MINFAANLNKMIDAGLGGPLDPPRTEVAVGHRVVYTEVSGDVVNFETNVAAPVKNLRVTMEPIQEGTGDPSPDNVRPISGRTEVTVTRSGINLWNEELEIGRIDPNTGQNSPNPNVTRSKTYIRIPQGEQIYTILPWAELFWYRADKSFIRVTATGNPEDGAVYGKLITPPSDAYFLRFRCSGVYGTTYKHDISINYPSTDHDYHAYDGQSATIQLGGFTVYGGTLDVSSGICHSLWANIPSYAGEDLPGEWISDRDVYAPGTVPTIGAQVVYKREIADMIILTPAQLTTLNGQNNVWSDAGNISLEYPYYEETEGY